MSKSNWQVVKPTVDPAAEGRLFFSEHEWATIDAATARIMPTDQDPGAQEAGAVRFIDRYLSGLDYIFASADGSGFLKLEGEPARAWRRRIGAMQQKYIEGVQKLDELAESRFKARFRDLQPEQQDQVLEELSGAPKPERVTLGKGEAVGSFLQGVSDDGLGFFEALALHTRQGYYCDPVYGGNQNRVGWKVAGFPGPKSLADTNTCEFSVREYFVLDAEWESLIPYLKERST